MQARFIQGIVWLVLIASSGCELVADFDRSKLDPDQPDTGVVVTPPPDEEDDAGIDASAVDASADASDEEDAG